MLYPIGPLCLAPVRSGGILTLPGTVLQLEACARGSYQRGLLSGSQRWSGADLKGNAARYSGRYHRSRRALLQRLASRGYVVVPVYLGRYRRKEIFLFPRQSLDTAQATD